MEEGSTASANPSWNQKGIKPFSENLFHFIMRHVRVLRLRNIALDGNTPENVSLNTEHTLRKEKEKLF